MKEESAIRGTLEEAGGASRSKAARASERVVLRAPAVRASPSGSRGAALGPY